ncbi:lantibiotic dehydratase C-terminal domain-containing protein [Virgisporangium aurantiacum]|uniref:Lantibiotic biosynthesis protein n=1 Tax=Virgisporangium aurantiacum TaxID=175570 RepID=A0A8J4E4P9_9ACTN|nr:lantibiotic dehydratase C-terminal domain-containing protein [Virgisporangium aurantiacum]GIJ62170.1 lantibiotic biosynthesis protein [Virgisporangium aurantiacum]
MTFKLGVVDDPQVPPASRPGDWQALHIFYSANSQPLLTDCVAPLVHDLRSRGLLDMYFFINYWMEGPHVRLRLKPATEAAVPAVRAAADTALGDFLSSRPALFDYDQDLLKIQDGLLVTEYPDEQERRRMYPDGRVPVQDNNTFHYRDYQPEYGRYGGPVGVALAERHFEFSSDLVIKLLQTMNVHIRPVLLGLAAQLMMISTSTFLRDTDFIVRFLERYREYWSSSFGLDYWSSSSDTVADGTALYQTCYDSMKDELAARFIDTHDTIQRGQLDHLTGFRAVWARHWETLREQVLDVGTAGKLTFIKNGTSRAPKVISKPDPLLPHLLASYVHMTNNRLGLSIADEAYLSYVLARTLQDNTGNRVLTS